jgi:GT2 family glycosyltransferase
LKKRFSVIVLTWNGRHYLQEYLPSVIASLGPQDECIVADNASTDDTASWLQEHAPTARHIVLDDNYGYCGGNNRAAEQAEGSFLLFLNNDVEVSPDWLELLVPSFENPDIAIAQPKLRAIHDRESFEYAGASGGYIDRYGYPFCRGRLFETVEQDEGQYDDTKAIFWASGAALAIRTEVFRVLEGFDEDFEFHMEEIDLCWRAQNRGYRVCVEPSSVVYHLGGGSLEPMNPRKTYFNYRNNLVMLIRNLPDAGFAWTLWMRLILDGVSAIPLALKGKWRHILAILRAHGYVYSKKRKLFAKRDKEKELRLNPGNPATLWPYSLIKAYFVQGKKRYLELKSSK